MKRLVLVAMALAGLALPADAQRGGGRPPREEMEADVRRAFARVVRQRVGLSDEQMQKLGPVAERHAVTRRRLQMDERALRAQMQVELLKDAPSDTAVARMLDQFTEIHKRRVQAMEAEQKDLAGIMTPVQRARFNALQEQVRRQLEMRRGGGPPMGEGGGNRPPPRRRPPGR